jgi:hypothetical protein
MYAHAPEVTVIHPSSDSGSFESDPTMSPLHLASPVPRTHDRLGQSSVVDGCLLAKVVARQRSLLAS